MPSPGSLKHLRDQRATGTRTIKECDHELARLAHLITITKPLGRAHIFRRVDVWLDERNRATH